MTTIFVSERDYIAAERLYAEAPRWGRAAFYISLYVLLGMVLAVGVARLGEEGGRTNSCSVGELE